MSRAETFNQILWPLKSTDKTAARIIEFGLRRRRKIKLFTSPLTHPILWFKLWHAGWTEGSLAPVHNYTSEYHGHCSICDSILWYWSGVPWLLMEKTSAHEVTKPLSESFVVSRREGSPNLVMNYIFVDCRPNVSSRQNIYR